MNPGFWAFDVGLRKNFPETEKQRVQLRLEFFNILNHPNWNGANTNPTSAQFGLITSKGLDMYLQPSPRLPCEDGPNGLDTRENSAPK